MRKAAHNQLGKKQTVKDVMIMNSGSDNPGNIATAMLSTL